MSSILTFAVLLGTPLLGALLLGLLGAKRWAPDTQRRVLGADVSGGVRADIPRHHSRESGGDAASNSSSTRSTCFW